MKRSIFSVRKDLLIRLGVKGEHCKSSKPNYVSSPFNPEIFRLAKFWNQGLLYHEYVYGRSLIIETLAVHCANLEENNNVEPSMSNCLKR